MAHTPQGGQGSPRLPGDGSYEVILSARASIKEETPGTVFESGTANVIQGAVSDDPRDGFYAFLSVGTINVPLVASHTSSCIGRNRFRIEIPGHSFVVTLDGASEERIVAGLEDILRWYTTWSGQTAPDGREDRFGTPLDDAQSVDGATMDAAAGFGVSGPGSSSSGLDGARGKIDRAGVRAADKVTSFGEKLNTSFKARSDARVTAAMESGTQRNMKLGGPVTAGVLDSTKKVAGTGAGLAATAIDKLSSAIGSGLANNKVMTSMRAAPENTKKRQMHDLLVSGAMACGRVYIAADNQGKLLFETAGDSAGRYAGARYGAEAEHATRALGNIGLSGYRIMRFPQKLTASSLVKGAVKGAGVAHAESARTSTQGVDKSRYQSAPAGYPGRYSDSAM